MATPSKKAQGLFIGFERTLYNPHFKTTKSLSNNQVNPLENALLKAIIFALSASKLFYIKL
ncbi:hypothetical protein MLS206_13160 [Helicobacter pylori]